MTVLFFIRRSDVAPGLCSEERRSEEFVTLKDKNLDVELHVRGLQPPVNAQLEQWLHEQRQVTKEAILAFLHDLPDPEIEPHKEESGKGESEK